MTRNEARIQRILHESRAWKDPWQWRVRARKFVADEVDTIVRTAETRAEATQIAREYLVSGYHDAWISQL